MKQLDRKFNCRNYRISSTPAGGVRQLKQLDRKFNYRNYRNYRNSATPAGGCGS